MKNDGMARPRIEGAAIDAGNALEKRVGRPYRSPTLVIHGDVRSLTLGPSPGIGESGLPLILRAGGSPSVPPFPPR